MDPVGAGFVDGTHFLAEPPQIGRQNGRRDENGLHDALGSVEPASGRTKRSIALAKPSSSYESVTRLACCWTCGLALPMATLRPLLRNIRRSFGISPMVAISLAGIESRFDSVVTTVPLLASGWVTSR